MNGERGEEYHRPISYWSIKLISVCDNRYPTGTIRDVGSKILKIRNIANITNSMCQIQSNAKYIRSLLIIQK